MRAILLLVLIAGCDSDEPLTPDLSSSVCRTPSGRVCGYDSLGGCPADDQCNWCDCSNPGGGFGCTQVFCSVDGAAGSERCQSAADCRSGQACVFDPGCGGEPGRCTSVLECRTGSAATWCGCDGSSFLSEGPCADRPHLGRGPC